MKEFFKGETPETTKLAKRTFAIVVLLNVVGFTITLLPYENATFLGGLCICVTFLIAMLTVIDNECKYGQEYKLRIRVAISSMICFMVALSMSFLVFLSLNSNNAEIHLESKVTRADNVKWEIVKPKELNLNGYRDGYYKLKITTLNKGELQTTIEPVYLNSEDLLKGEELSNLSLYKYKKTVYNITPFGKYKDHDEIYYELKE
jgi:hypothetical protein